MADTSEKVHALKDDPRIEADVYSERAFYSICSSVSSRGTEIATLHEL